MDEALLVVAFEDVHGAPVVVKGPVDRPEGGLGSGGIGRCIPGRRRIQLLDHDIAPRSEQAL